MNSVIACNDKSFDLYRHPTVAQLRRLPHCIVPWAVSVADAGQDHHDRPLAGFTAGARELHQGGLGSVWGAATAVCAGAAVARFVGLDAGAVLVGEVDGCIAPYHSLAFTASLGTQCERHILVEYLTPNILFIFHTHVQ